MKNVFKRNKFDIGLVPQALNNTNATGDYYPMQYYRKALFLLTGGAMAATKTSKIEVLQAKDAAGTGAKALTNAEAIITANTAVTKATLTLATVLAADAVTINGLVFTAHTNTTTKALRQFKIDGDDTADAAALVSCINDPTYGVSGVMASNTLGVITLKVTNPGETTITVKDAAATITAATTQAIAYVEINTSSLDLAGDFEYVAAKVTTTATTVVAVDLLRTDARFEATQYVGDGAVV